MTSPGDSQPGGPGASTRAATQVMIACGEASGDLYAGALTRALRAIDPAISVFGLGGAKLQAAGADLVADYRDISVTGLFEAVSVLPRSWRILRALEAAARARRPDVFVAVDFPDFNFRLLPVMAGLGVPIVYYISPQLWAWRAGRMKTLRQYVARMLVIFPFEQAIYEQAGVPVEFVGHPLVDLAGSRQVPTASRFPDLDPAKPLVAFLPGSRPNEVRRLLPVLVDAVPIVRRRVPDAQFAVARAPSLDDRLFVPLDQLRKTSVPLTVVEDATDDVLAAADVVVTASGTATVQAALHARPMVIIYRLSALTYALGRSFVRVSTFGMVNLVAGRPVVPELIQDRCTPVDVAAETVGLLTDAPRREAMMRDLADVRAALGGGGASRRAALAVLHAAGRSPDVGGV